MFDRRPERRERFSHYRVYADFFRTENEHMFAKKGVRRITPDERRFALCFARTLSVKRSCAAAGFEGRTSFARASRLLERDDVRVFVRSELLRENAATAPCGVPGATDTADGTVLPDCVREPCGEGAAVSLHPEAKESEVSAVSAPNEFAGSESANTACAVSALTESAGSESAGSPSAVSAPTESADPTSPAVYAPDGDDAAQTPGFDARSPENAASHVCGTACAPDNAEVCGTDGSELSYDLIEERILREYERIAFADTDSGEVKIADKLRALEQYRAIAAQRHSRDESSLSLTVNYDYGDGRE